MEKKMDKIFFAHPVKTSEVELHENDVCRISSYEPWTQIVCKKGILWLTQTGDGVDHILSAGDQFVSHRRGRVLIEALPEALVCIVPPSPN
jgi:hypothetical protein